MKSEFSLFIRVVTCFSLLTTLVSGHAVGDSTLLDSRNVSDESGGGGIANLFIPNNEGLPRPTVNSASVGAVSSGRTVAGNAQASAYEPVLAVIVDSNNVVRYFVLNGLEGPNPPGTFPVPPDTSAIPEPGVTGLAIVVLAGLLLTRRRRRLP